MRIAMSKERKDSILTGIENRKNMELNAFGSPTYTFFGQAKADTEFVERWVFGDLYDVRAQAPDGWFEQMTSVTVEVTEIPPEERVDLLGHASASAVVNVKFYRPRSFTYGTRMPLSWEHAPEGIKAGVRTQIERSRIANRWNAIRTKVSSYIETCKTVNVAVENWPELEGFLTADMRDALKMPEPPRSKATKAAPVLAAEVRDELRVSLSMSALNGVKV